MKTNVSIDGVTVLTLAAVAVAGYVGYKIYSSTAAAAKAAAKTVNPSNPNNPVYSATVGALDAAGVSKGVSSAVGTGASMLSWLTPFAPLVNSLTASADASTTKSPSSVGTFFTSVNPFGNSNTAASTYNINNIDQNDNFSMGGTDFGVNANQVNTGW